MNPSGVHSYLFFDVPVESPQPLKLYLAHITDSLLYLLFNKDLQEKYVLSKLLNNNDLAP